jgi:hypothetical protein
MLCASLVALVFALSPPATLSQEEAEKLVFASWRWEWLEESGMPKEPNMCVRFSRDGPEYWLWSGELSPALADEGDRIVIDPTTHPMRIDFYFVTQFNKECVIPCIWRVEGSGDDLRLVIVKPYGSERVEKGKEFQQRPTGFVSTKENKYKKLVLAPCDYLEMEGSKPAKPDPKAKPPEKK